MRHIKRREHLAFGYELFIAAISILSVVNMIISFIPGVDPDAVNVVYIINTVLSLLFIFDFMFRFLTAPNRYTYFIKNYGWADLVAIFPALRIFRLYRIYKAYRIIAKYGIDYITSYLSYNRAQSALYILIIMVTLIIECGAVMVLQAEQAASSPNIITASDAIWWAYVTITTVGYGDRFPVTALGRIVGIFVLTTGVAVFATFAGLISSKLLSTPEKEKESVNKYEEEIENPAQYLSELKQLINERQEIDAKITARIKKLEQLVNIQQNENVNDK